jgi:hypothetical protein
MTPDQHKIITSLYFKHLSNHCEIQHTEKDKTCEIPEEYTLYTIQGRKYICDITFDHDIEPQGTLLVARPGSGPGPGQGQAFETFDLHDPNFETECIAFIESLLGLA